MEELLQLLHTFLEENWNEFCAFCDEREEDADAAMSKLEGEIE